MGVRERRERREEGREEGESGGGEVTMAYQQTPHNFGR